MNGTTEAPVVARGLDVEDIDSLDRLIDGIHGLAALLSERLAEDGRALAGAGLLLYLQSTELHDRWEEVLRKQNPR